MPKFGGGAPASASGGFQMPAPQPRAAGGGLFAGLDAKTRYDMVKGFLASAMSSAQSSNSPLLAALAPMAGALIGGRAGASYNASQDASRSETNDALLDSIYPGSGQGGAGPRISAPDPMSPQGIATDAMAAIGKSTFTPGDRESFVKAMWPHAKRVSQRTGLDPRIIIAQAAQETGWGKSAPNNNFFGIKSHGQSGGATMSTQEYLGGGGPTTVQDSFRTYDGMGQSADDYGTFLQQNPRYRSMLGAQGLDSQLAALGQSGYATDPNYSASVGNIARSIAMPGESAQGGEGFSVGDQRDRAAELLDILNDPMASEEQSGLARALLMQIMKPQDPGKALELEKNQLEVDRLRKQGSGYRKATAAEAARYGAKSGQFGPDGRFYRTDKSTDAEGDPNNPMELNANDRLGLF